MLSPRSIQNFRDRYPILDYLMSLGWEPKPDDPTYGYCPFPNHQGEERSFEIFQTFGVCYGGCTPVHYELAGLKVLLGDTPIISREREVSLEDLRPGAIFVTRSGTYAVKSQYRYSSDNLHYECILLASGEYAHFPEGNKTMVREVQVKTDRRGDE